MIRFRAGRRSFTLISPDGTRRQYSWLVLAPFLVVPALFFAVLALQSEIVVRNYVSEVKRNPALIGSAVWTFKHVQEKSLENLVFALPEPADSELPTLRLFLENNSLIAMQEAKVKGDEALGHDPGGDKPYFRGYLIDAQSKAVKKAKVCLRGAGNWHHMPEKPSLRVKIRQADITRGQRYLELQRPEDALALKNWLPDKIGAEMGLFSDQSKHVRLFINNRYFGVYLQTMRPGEPLAVVNGRMPGTFFKGDFQDDLWDTVESWRLEGEASEADLAHFTRFLAVLQSPPSPEALASLAALVDLDVYARWAALMIATGSVHTDAEHNHLYFLCSNQGRLEVIPWDSNSYGVHVTADVPADLILHPLMDRLTRDPRWVLLRNRYVHQLLEGACHPDRLGPRIDAAVARMRGDLEADVNLNSVEYMNSGLEVVPWSVRDIDPKREEIKRFAAQRHEFLTAYLADARVTVSAHADLPEQSAVTVSGAAAVEVRTAGGEVPASNGDPATPGLLHSGLSEALVEYMGYSFERRFKGRYHSALPGAVTYTVAAPPSELRFSNAITGVTVTPSETATDSAPSRTLHPSGFQTLPSDDVVLGPGELELSEDLITAPGQRLIVRAGTVIRLAPGVGIYSRGETHVEGTAEAPVKLEPLGDQPWACFGVSRAPLTRIEHLRAWGGSSGTDGSVRFKGMVSVYDCPDVVLRGCQFGANLLSDDAVNLGECERILVEDCVWQDARSDALDLDMCRGEVRRCRWIDSGNDGLDMMSCQLVVRDCRFEGSGDKGISVGEGSRVRVQDCQVERCHIGLEAKDACRALVQNTRFVDNRVAVNAYQKKWIYPGGGRALLVDCEISGSQVVDLSIKRRSRITLLRTEALTIDRIKGLSLVDELPEEYRALAAELEPAG